MYHEMLNEIDQNQIGASPGDESASRVPGVLSTSAAVFRNQHLLLRGQVIDELKKCHEECDNMAALVTGAGLMCDLHSNFTFNDALSFRANPPRDAADRALNTLKEKIATAVQSVASQADTLCQTQEEREAFSNRLERQFETIRSKLIQDETARTADKLFGLCDRVESVVGQLSSFGASMREARDRLGDMARSLRLYAPDSLGFAVVRSHQLNGGVQTDIPVADFFDQLNTLIVDTYSSLRDQAAA